jgi:hypothetical protein
MARGAQVVLVGLLMVITRSAGLAALAEVSTLRPGSVVTAATEAAPPADRRVPNILWRIDFTDYAGGSVEAWLDAKGFRLAHGAEDPEALALSHHAGVLVLEAKHPVRGFVVSDPIMVANFSTIRVTWGIIKYPTGASYARQINNEALMVYIAFGQDPMPNGHVLIPAQSYFIGLFMGQEASLNTLYQGRYFHEGGRFVCVGDPPPYETVRSEFDLRTAFQAYFGKAEVPMISKVSLGVDTFASGEGGTAAAYIHRIEVLE